MALSSATPLPGRVGQRTPRRPRPPRRSRRRSRGPSVVGEVDQLDVQPQVERVDPRRRLPGAGPRPSRTSRSSAVTSSRPPRSASSRCSNQAELSGPLDSSAAVAVRPERGRAGSRASAGSGVGRVQQPVRPGQVGQHLRPSGPGSRSRTPPRSGCARCPPAPASRRTRCGPGRSPSPGPGPCPPAAGWPRRASRATPRPAPGGSTPSARTRCSPYTSCRNDLDRPGPLDQPVRQALPLVRADHPRHQVDREPALLAARPRTSCSAASIQSSRGCSRPCQVLRSPGSRK